MRKIFLVFLIFLTPSITKSQGLIDGFMRGAGKGVVALSYSSENYKNFYKGTTLVSEPNLGTITTQSISLFAAVGLLNQLDIVASLPYITASPSQGTLSSQSAIQDIAIALKWKPIELKIENIGTVSGIVSAGVSTPMSEYVADAAVAVGHHFSSGDVRVLGNFMTDFGLFASVQAGYNRRGDVNLDHVTLDGTMKTTVPDAVDISTKIGFGTSEYYIDAWIQNQTSRGGTDIGNTDASFPSNGVSFSRIGFTGYYPLPLFDRMFGVSISGSNTLDGRNVGNSTRFSVGLVYGLTLWK